MITEKISNGGILSGTINASSNLTMGIGSSNNLVGGNINTFTKEIDPTIPDYIKAISKEDIAGWDNNAVVNEEQNKTLMGLEELIDIITPKNTVKGELVHITDALNLPTFETTADGNVEQETTRGINLCPTDFSAWESGHYDTNGNKTEYPSRLRLKEPLKIPNQELYFDTNNNDVNFLVRTCDENGTFIRNAGFVMRGSTFTPEANETHLLLAMYIDTYSYETYKEQFESGGIKPIICLNSATDKTWEKFTNGASPNPDYPQEIEVIDGYNLCNGISQGLYVTGSAYTFGKTDTDSGLCIKVDGKSSYTISTIDTQTRYRVAFTKVNPLEVREGSCFDGVILDNSNSSVTKSSIGYGYLIVNATDLTKIQIVKGNGSSFVPYGHVGYKVNGKNIFDRNRNRNSFTVKPTYENDKILWQGTGSYSFVDYKVNCKPNTKYTISFSDKNCVVVLSKKSNATDTINWDVANNYVFTTTDNMNEFYIRFTGSGSLTYYVDKFQIELDKATPYEPYKEQIVYLDLKGNWVGAINDNIKDYLVTDKKKYWLVKNVEKGILSFKRIYDGTNHKFAYFDKPTNQLGYDTWTRVPIMSEISNVGITDKEFVITTSASKTENALLLSLDSTLTIEELKVLADGKPFYYPLAEPEIIELGKLPEPIKTFEGVNNIQVLANLDTEIEVKHALDVKKYADDRYFELTNALISTGANL